MRPWISPHEPRLAVRIPPAIGDRVLARKQEGGLVTGELVALDPPIVQNEAGEEFLCCDGNETEEHAPRLVPSVPARSAA